MPVELKRHRARGVAVEGCSALRGGILENPTILRIAQSLGSHTGPGGRRRVGSFPASPGKQPPTMASSPWSRTEAGLV
jgi:hypothetical protein